MPLAARPAALRGNLATLPSHRSLRQPWSIRPNTHTHDRNITAFIHRCTRWYTIPSLGFGIRGSHMAADWVVAEDVILSLYSSGSTCLRGLNEITVIQLGPRGTEMLPRFLPSPSLSPLGPSQPPGFICACSYTTFIFNNETRKSHKIIGSISERGSNCLDPVFIFVSSVFHL